jgi:hypothetical protein
MFLEQFAPQTPQLMPCSLGVRQPFIHSLHQTANLFPLRPQLPTIMDDLSEDDCLVISRFPLELGPLRTTLEPVDKALSSEKERDNESKEGSIYKPGKLHSLANKE